MTLRRKAPWSARRIHLWVAVVLALPLTLIAVSGVLIAVRSVAPMQVPMAWLRAETIPERLPPTAYLEDPAGVAWIGNPQGLYRVTADGAEAVAHFSGQEIVALAALAGNPSPVVATRMAVWTQVDGQWQAVRRGRVRQLSRLPDGRVLAIAGGRGEMADGRPYVTVDGRAWEPHRGALAAVARTPPLTDPQVALHQFMREVHSGAYFLGKGPGEIAWSGLFGAVLVLLSLTGLWMWWRRERRRAAERRDAVPALAGAPAARPLERGA